MPIERRNPQQAIGRRKLESTLRNILSSMEDVILELDRDGNILFMSKAIAGYDIQDILGRDFCDWAPESDHATMRAALEKVFTSGATTWYQTQNTTDLGAVRWYESRLSPVMRDDAVRSAILINLDITQRKQIELEAEKQAYLIQLFYNLPFIGMTIAEPSTRRWIQVNDKICEIMGYRREELLQRTWESLTHPDDLAMSVHEYECVMRSESNSYSLEKRFLHKSGSVIHTTVDVHCARNAQGEPDYFVATIQDITARKLQEARIHHMAHHDLLTDLPNRTLLSDRISQSLLIAKRNGSGFATLFMDLDNFKPVNDEYGHATGDLLLKAVAQRIQTCVRASDTVARMGGDEFVVLLAPVESKAQAVQVAEKIHAALAEPFELLDGHTALISSSIGIAMYPEHADTEDALVRCADNAMYAAKAAGRDCVVVYIAP
ncbi:MAG: diguanylate cyclase [Rhodoferax sp.]|nr:diguanylate cyclase [Rhodoferax sp.]